MLQNPLTDAVFASISSFAKGQSSKQHEESTKRRIESINTEIAILRQNIARDGELTTETEKAFRKRQETLEAQMRDLQHHQERQDAAIDVHKKGSDALKRCVSDLDKGLNARMDSIDQSVKSAEDAAKSAVQDFTNQSSEFRAKTLELASKVSQLSDEARSAQQNTDMQVSTQRKICEDTTAAVAELRATIQKYEEKMIELTDLVLKLNSAVEKMRKQNCELPRISEEGEARIGQRFGLPAARPGE